MKITILHSACCASESPIKNEITEIATANNIDVNIEELSELQDTITYGTMTFPSIVINGQVYDYKKFRSPKILLAILQG
jgi:glutaredoxin